VVIAISTSRLLPQGGKQKMREVTYPACLPLRSDASKTTDFFDSIFQSRIYVIHIQFD
jgi:hypothetical protein